MVKFLLKKDLACTYSACSKVGVYIMAEILCKILGKKQSKIGDLICDHDLTN